MTEDLRLLEAFLNTVDERTFRRHGTAHAGRELLVSTPALSDWLDANGLLPPGAVVRGADLEAAVRLRTALRRTLLAEPGQEQAATVLAAFPLHLVPDGEGLLRLAVAGASVLNPIVETAAAAVVNGSWARVKICAAPDCRWAFHDVSRSGAGRWCSMEVCGNRTKTRTYRRRRTAVEL